ncbi:hypothetical protein DNTS_028304 [Danionella cerebrum]|uniref:C-type lectin domain-containing protein n=1 Tax=Danionella cerebrum TaxID=2873325 RepID=A0A553NL77_9TELE|nr:hypothetical protein DNTS_028304 [Danionella translucida]
MESRLCRVTFFYLVFITFSGHVTRGEDTADGRTWLTFDLNCYHFVHGAEDVAKSYSLQDAKDICRGYGLLTVRSADENEFVVKYSPSVWKGSMNVWLGLYYDSDGSALSFSNWEDGGFEDSDLPLMDTCVALHSSTGRWENISCTDEPENGVICKTKSRPMLSALVIISVLLILLISALIWFLQQRKSSGSSILSLMEYHPPFGSPSADQTCLVEAEEINQAP